LVAESDRAAIRECERAHSALVNKYQHHAEVKRSHILVSCKQHCHYQQQDSRAAIAEVKYFL
jgi:hypothetical protein